MSRSEKSRNEVPTSQEMEEREMEEREMVQELMNIGIYEDGLSYNQMKDILGFVTESKRMAKMETESRASQALNLHSPPKSPVDPGLKSNITQNVDGQEHVGTHKTSNMPVAYDRRSIHVVDSNKFPSDSFEKKGMKNRCRELDDKMIDQAQSTSILHSMGSKGSSRDSHITDGNFDLQSKFNQKIERWRLNPLDVPINEADVPLQTPCRLVNQKMSSPSVFKNIQDLDTSDKSIAIVDSRLDKIANMWHSWHRTTADSEFQWGSPIKVGVANDSLDRKSLTESRYANKIEEPIRKTYERSSKRKAYTTIMKCLDSSDETDDNDRISIKKKKSMQEPAKTMSKIIQPKPQQSGIDNESIPDTKTVIMNDDRDSSSSNDIFDTKDSKSNKTIKPKRLTLSLTRTPGNKVDTVLQERKDIKQVTEGNLIIGDSDDESNANTEQVIPAILMSDDEDEIMDTDEDRKISETEQEEFPELKVLKTKGIFSRLQSQCSRLKNLQQEEEKRRKQQEEEKLKKKEELQKQKEEREKKRIQEEIELAKSNEIKEKQLKAKEERWANMIKTRERAKEIERRRLREIAEAKKKMEQQEKEREERLLRDDDDIEILHSNVDNNSGSCTTCPICNESFPDDEIQNHAAQCEQYDTSDKGNDTQVETNRNSNLVSETLKCYVCKKFRTDDGRYYDDHVHRCLESKKDSPDDGLTASTSWKDPNNHTADTEIRYRVPPPSKNKERKYPGKKRKR